MADPTESDFYVGYLPDAPPHLASWLRPRVGLLLLASGALALLIVLAQRPFASAFFEYGTTRTFEGWVSVDPYPLLAVERPGGGHSRFLLAAFGKKGAREETRGFAGKRVRLEGTLAFRDDQTMIELVAGSLEIQPGPGTRPVPDNNEDREARTYVGEIVDSKCFLGVMRPGDSKPHRACATRCISGGIPPVLLVRDATGSASYFLLATEDGKAVGPDVLDMIAEPVEITGRVVRYDDLRLLLADPATYRRID